MKDARGHGSEKRGSEELGPSNKTAIGHFMKASAGIHRNVPGHGEVPTGQGQPVTERHSNMPSVGTDGGGGAAMPAGAEDRINKTLAPLRQKFVQISNRQRPRHHAHVKMDKQNDRSFPSSTFHAEKKPAQPKSWLSGLPLHTAGMVISGPGLYVQDDYGNGLAWGASLGAGITGPGVLEGDATVINDGGVSWAKDTPADF